MAARESPDRLRQRTFHGVDPRGETEQDGAVWKVLSDVGSLRRLRRPDMNLCVDDCHTIVNLLLQKTAELFPAIHLPDEAIVEKL
jgi:hypothetical protein